MILYRGSRNASIKMKIIEIFHVEVKLFYVISSVLIIWEVGLRIVSVLLEQLELFSSLRTGGGQKYLGVNITLHRSHGYLDQSKTEYEKVFDMVLSFTFIHVELVTFATSRTSLQLKTLGWDIITKRTDIPN